MGINTLDRIFRPKRIALIGVTPNPNSVSGKLLSNLISGGFSGVVYPVNPDSEAVMGIPCYPDVSKLPKRPDLGIICAPAEHVPGYVRQCGEAGISGVVIISAGFRETGEAGRDLEKQILAEKARFDGMRILGPNCLGFIAPGSRLNASFANGMPKAGHVAFVSQSGALCTSVLDWALQGKIGFSCFVSLGNTLDIGFGDLIDYLGEDPETESIILYIESVENARRFMSAARAFARTKPIIVYKAGRFPESAQAAASHTGALASEDAVYDAAFQRVGLARVYDIGEIFDCAELIGRNKIPRGPRLAIVTNAGGPGVMATDALIAENGVLATFNQNTLEQLDESLPSAWSHGNPVDVLGDARSKRIEKAVQIVLGDPGVDAVLVILTPQAMTNPVSAAKAVGRLTETTSKPILAAWLGGQSMREAIPALIDAGVAAYQTPERAIRAFMTLVAYARNLDALYETPKDIPIAFSYDRTEIRSRFSAQYFGSGGILSEEVSKALVEAYGIPTTRPQLAANADEAARIASRVGYPVVLKIHSPEITHKTDVGGVALNLEDETMVRSAFDHMISNVRVRRPDATLLGTTVQPMIKKADGLEMILGIKKDPIFGTVILAGMGGVTAELMNDRALAFPPLNERLAMRMLESLKIWPLFNGYRGRKPLDTRRLVEVLIRMSYLAADYPEIAELDLNPLLVTPDGVIALDARIVVDETVMGKPTEPYAHLALRPYPEILVSAVELRDGTQVTLRPIKPEDEPLWMELLRSCSRESIYSRFRYSFHWDSHQVAVRYCYIDYNREIAIVAEIEENGVRKLIGVGRLIADPDHEAAEYAVLIADAWQKKDLGSILTDCCLDIAKQWKLKRFVAQTTTDNRPMISVFEKRGFRITVDDDSTVDVALDIA